MTKKSPLPQTPRHIPVYDEDWELFESCFGPAGLKPVGIATVLRSLMHQYAMQIREAQNNAATAAQRTRLTNSPSEKTNANTTTIHSLTRGSS